jgi:hypothetical protein
MSHSDSKRALRRHHYLRMKAKVRRLNRDVYNHGEIEIQRWEGNDHPWWGRSRSALWGRWANNISWCSCCGCGNPRVHFGSLTRQELRANCDSLDEIDV